MSEKNLLQAVVALGSLVPIVAGLSGVIFGTLMTGAESASTLSLDSHFRYLSGLLFAIGISFVSTIPNIETKAPRFQLLSLVVFIGGLARLYGLVTQGPPGAAMLFGLFMELIVTPSLALWQRRVARTSLSAIQSRTLH